MVNMLRDSDTHPEATPIVQAITENELMQSDCWHLHEVANDNSGILAAVMSFAWSECWRVYNFCIYFKASRWGKKPEVYYEHVGKSALNPLNRI